MILRHHSRGLLCPLVLFLVFASVSSLTIRREPVTEQVLVITTSDPLLQDETPAESRDAEESSTTAEIVNDLQNDEVATTVDTLVVADSTGESWEVDPTASSIVSKDVQIEINPSASNKIVDSESEQSGNADNSKPVLPEIYSFHIRSDVRYRYSQTYITSRVANKDSLRSHEVTFNVVLPETAFISKFIMEIDGKPYEAYVREKEEAKKEYQQAQSQGQSAGLVEKSTRNSNVFNVNVNIKPQSKVTFNLTYEELLTRRLGRYEQAININPDQVSSIKDYEITVNIEESRNLTFVRVPSLSNDIDDQDASGNNLDAVIERPAPNKAKISWSPTTSDQKKLIKEGISGKFLVQYDVDRESDGGQILVMQGYFVHFFAPENLPPLKKHVVFILDISGSMWGRKMEQLKESQKKILDDLTTDDYFNIITFSSDVYLWSPNDKIIKEDNVGYRQPVRSFTNRVPAEVLAKRQPLSASPENIQKAKAFIDSLIASGGTNIHDAITEALNLTAVIKEAQMKAHNPSTEAIVEDTTVLPSSLASASPTTAGTSSNTEANNIVYSSTSSPTTTTTTTTTISSSAVPSSSTDGVLDEEENSSIIIVDIAKSEPLEGITDAPEEVSATTLPTSDDTILPPNVQSLIIFLTDGEPTVGVTDPPEIQRLIQAANRNLTIPIFSLGFGEGADFPFLKKLSLQNHGFGRKIYEASDAALQLKGFYNEIASPLLSNVKFNYTSSEFNVTDLTVTKFPTVFGGTEIAVAGKLVAPPKPERVDEDETTISPSNDAQPTTEILLDDDDTPELDAPSQPERLSIACDFELTDRLYLDVAIEGNGRDGEVDLHDVEFYDRRKCGVGIDFPIPFLPPSLVYPPRPTPPPSPEDIFLERLWAYLTIQQLLEEDLAQGDSNTNSEDVSPTSTIAPDSSIVTLALPVQSPTTPSPSRANVTKPETPKERALRLALKYGFVTPLTSLVVVKPNSSDVTNAVPSDARPDSYDGGYGRYLNSRGGPSAIAVPLAISRSSSNIITKSRSSISIPRNSLPIGHSRSGIGRVRAPHSLSSLSLAAFAPPALMSIRNKIASQPLPLPIHSNNYYLSTPAALPVPHGAQRHPPSDLSYAPLPISFQGASAGGGFSNYDLSEESLQIVPSPPASRTTVVPTATTSAPSTAPTTLALNDVNWLSSINNVLHVNGSDFIVAQQNDTMYGDFDNGGYDCAIELTKEQGKCSHLQDCVLSAIAINQRLFETSYFCPISSKKSAVSYVGVCCPQRLAKGIQVSDEEP